MAANDAVGFHTARWAESFRRCAATWAPVAPPAPRTFIAPLGPDPADLAASIATDEVLRASQRLEAETGDRALIVRVDRIELSKNVLRGFHAYDELLERHPEWRERVTFAAFMYPSREGLPEYLAYRQEAEGLVRLINHRWGTAGWTPILFDAGDDYPRSLAALQRADVLLVNPIRDGLNLVAKEGMVVNERSCSLVLSTEAGAWAELGEAGALRVNPFDVSQTADALHTALTMDGAERAERAAGLRAASLARTPKHWLADQLAAADVAS
jgi:trehalose 6-phosphate synthase